MAEWVMLGGHMYDGEHMDGDWVWVVMVPFMMLVLVATVLLVVWLARGWHGSPPAGTGSGPESAIEILDRRLASGEITPDEYRERREILRGN